MSRPTARTRTRKKVAKPSTTSMPENGGAGSSAAKREADGGGESSEGDDGQAALAVRAGQRLEHHEERCRRRSAAISGAKRSRLGGGGDEVSGHRTTSLATCAAWTARFCLIISRVCSCWRVIGGQEGLRADAHPDHQHDQRERWSPIRARSRSVTWCSTSCGRLAVEDALHHPEHVDRPRG